MNKTTTKSFSTFTKVLSLALILLIGGICFQAYLKDSEFFWSKEEKFFYQKLHAFKESSEKEILLKDLTNFDWDNVCFVWPYGGIGDQDLRNFKLDKSLPVDDDSRFSIIFFDRSSKTGRAFILDRELKYSIEPNSDRRQEFGDCRTYENSFVEKRKGKIYF